MMLVLVFVGMFLGAGFAMYGMVCERIVADRERRAARRSRHTEAVLVPRRTFAAAKPIGPVTGSRFG